MDNQTPLTRIASLSCWHYSKNASAAFKTPCQNFTCTISNKGNVVPLKSRRKFDEMLLTFKWKRAEPKRTKRQGRKPKPEMNLISYSWPQNNTNFIGGHVTKSSRHQRAVL